MIKLPLELLIAWATKLLRKGTVPELKVVQPAQKWPTEFAQALSSLLGPETNLPVAITRMASASGETNVRITIIALAVAKKEGLITNADAVLAEAWRNCKCDGQPNPKLFCEEIQQFIDTSKKKVA